jgi:hypothetical protein
VRDVEVVVSPDQLALWPEHLVQRITVPATDDTRPTLLPDAWLQRVDQVVRGAVILHRVDPASTATATIDGTALCRTQLAQGAWWRISDAALQHPDAAVWWRTCPRCETALGQR